MIIKQIFLNTKSLLKYFILLVFFGLSFISVSSFSEAPSNLEEIPSHLDKIKKLKVKNISDLKHLSPFEDVVVIQKRYFPKTKRFEIGLSILGVMNNKFFYLGGLKTQLGFFIKDKHGFGFEAHQLYSLESTVTKDLKAPDINGILAFNPFVSHYFLGGYYKWSPVYGKFSILNKKIIYFDGFFTLGGGVTRVRKGISENALNKVKVNEEGEGASSKNLFASTKDKHPTLSLGVGQLFAYNKSFGFFWELKAYLYDKNLKDLNFYIGGKYYFPGVSHR